jgi:hypothetical protein
VPTDGTPDDRVAGVVTPCDPTHPGVLPALARSVTESLAAAVADFEASGSALHEAVRDYADAQRALGRSATAIAMSLDDCARHAALPPESGRAATAADAHTASVISLARWYLARSGAWAG